MYGITASYNRVPHWLCMGAPISLATRRKFMAQVPTSDCYKTYVGYFPDQLSLQKNNYMASPKHPFGRKRREALSIVCADCLVRYVRV